MQAQMYNDQKDGELAGLISLAIGFPLTIAIIEASDSLRWYDFFWLVWLVFIGVGIVLVLIGVSISTLWRKVTNSTDSPVDYIENPNRNVRRDAKNIASKSITRKRRPSLANINKLLQELNSLIGLQRVKDEVTSLINTVKINMLRRGKGLKQSLLSLHLVFSGNPGTGKTTVARILGKIYYKLGILSRGHLVETDRAGLVAGYVGQTAIQTKAIIERAKGGILFIDEAYSLTPQNTGFDFGQEAVDTLLKAMEDYRNNFIVIVAGYPDLMKNFIKSNPGLESRFNTFINFEDYNPNELLEIFMSLCKQHNYIVDISAIDVLTKIFQDIYTNADKSNANARTVRNFFEKSIKRQANRLANSVTLSTEDLQTLILEDLIGGYYER